jgi:Flp pilus assembly CpaF family ATPase
MLRTAMGPLIAAALEDPDVVEIMLNPDRTLWVDRLSSGRAPMGVELSEADGERIIRLVAAHVGAEVHRGQPLLSAELPETGERFEGILPPGRAGAGLRAAQARHRRDPAGAVRHRRDDDRAPRRTFCVAPCASGRTS